MCVEGGAGRAAEVDKGPAASQEVWRVCVWGDAVWGRGGRLFAVGQELRRMGGRRGLEGESIVITMLARPCLHPFLLPPPPRQAAGQEQCAADDGGRYSAAADGPATRHCRP